MAAQPARLSVAQPPADSLARPLPEETREALEPRLGFDLSRIRIHADDGAARFTERLDARAATVGEHIYFARGEYRPDGEAGRHLLAHELAHTAQPGASDVVRRQPRRKRQKPIHVGVLQFFNDESRHLPTLDTPLMVPLHVLARKPWSDLKPFTTYPLQREEVTGNRITYRFAGGAGEIKLSVSNKTELEQMKKAHATQLRVDFGISIPTGDKKDEDKEVKQVDKPTTSSLEEDVELPIKGLGLIKLKLPSAFKKLAAFILNAMMSQEEIKNLNQLLEGIRTLGDKADKLGELLSEPIRIVELLIGLEPPELTPVLSAIAGWVNRPPNEKARKKIGREKALKKIARKIARLIDALRAALKPVFLVRSGFQTIIGLATAAIGVPGVREVVELAKSGGDRAKLEKMVGELGTAATGQLVGPMRELIAFLQFPEEALKDVQLITPGDIGAALANYAPKLVKAPHLKVILLAARAAGALEKIGQALADALIPPDALKSLNEKLMAPIAKLIGPFGKQAASLLTTVVDAVEPELQKAITSTFGDVILRRSPAGDDEPVSLTGAMRAARRSSAQPMPGPLRSSMEGRFGHDFARVRIHADGPAAQAAASVSARAFTVGDHIYFGRGQHRPDTAAGRRLVAHELTHVLQNQAGGPPTLRRTTLDSIKKRFVNLLKVRVLKGATTAISPDPATAAKVDALLVRLARYVLDKRISRSRVRSILEPGYVLVHDRAKAKKTGKKPKVKGLRRRARYVLFLPPLSIRGGKVVLKLRKPHSRDRRQLRKAKPKCHSKAPRYEQAHHVIPLQLKEHKLIKLAISGGFAFNGSANKKCLPISYHNGPHRSYTEMVERKLDALWMTLGHPTKWTPEADGALRSLLRKLKSGLRRRQYVLGGP